MAEFHLRIVASDKVFYSGMTEIVILPGLDGEYAFMAKHEEMVVAVRPGELRFSMRLLEPVSRRRRTIV